ncbi:MAG TPA: circadian clock KaiB family protein [Vicinamibacterales bacterium]|nr:circadian clock KaiB family protein [Vicinamibacterales bacterium]
MSPRPSRRAQTPSVELVLYISTTSSSAAPATRDCEALLARFDRRAVRLEICDVSQQPDRAETDGICFTPMLLKKQPLPRTYIAGDLSNTAALVDLLVSCGVEPLDDAPQKDSHRGLPAGRSTPKQ